MFRSAAPLAIATIAAACGGPPALDAVITPGPEIAGCPVFPDGPWSTPVDFLPRDPRSAELIAAMSPDAPLTLSVGTTETFHGIPFTVVPPPTSTTRRTRRARACSSWR